MDNNKDMLVNRFKEAYSVINREGADKLLNYLEKSSDFFDAPASSRESFHLCFPQGLLLHSLNVYENLKWFNEKLNLGLNEESVAICGLLHDVCKTGMYKQTVKRKKEADGRWVDTIGYIVDEDIPYGHGEKSVYIISSFMKLTREEAMAINWHMGAFDDRVKGGSYALNNAIGKYPLLFWLMTADMKAASLDEKDVK